MVQPRVLVMDLGGVTCRWLPERRLAALSQLSGLPMSTIDQHVFESGFDDAGERGGFDLAEFTATLGSVLGLDGVAGARDELRAAWAQAFEPDHAVLRLVQSTPVRTALFTNNGPLLEACLQAELSDVGQAFGELLFSWRLGCTKPDPDAFVRATEVLGVEPGEIVFVDDSEANVAAARTAGWDPIGFTTALDLQAALADRGLRG